MQNGLTPFMAAALKGRLRAMRTLLGVASLTLATLDAKMCMPHFNVRVLGTQGAIDTTVCHII